MSTDTGRFCLLWAYPPGGAGNDHAVGFTADVLARRAERDGAAAPLRFPPAWVRGR